MCKTNTVCHDGTVMASNGGWIHNFPLKDRILLTSKPDAKVETYYNEVNGICQAIKCFYNCNCCHIHRKYHFPFNTAARLSFSSYSVSSLTHFPQIVLFLKHSTCHHPFQLEYKTLCVCVSVCELTKKSRGCYINEMHPEISGSIWYGVRATATETQSLLEIAILHYSAKPVNAERNFNLKVESIPIFPSTRIQAIRL